MARSSSKEVGLRWETIIRKQRESGLTIARWCRENQVLASAFHYWKGKLCIQFPIDRRNFLELVDEKRTGIIIECANFRICVDSNFNSETLRQCLTLLRQIC
jgi:hypothetical protein